ncbi:hypothetical protein GCM10020001_094470 [Nonomuraea salmonea]
MGVMYCARLRPGDFAGYHTDTMSSLYFTDGTHGSAREVSFRCRDVTPTGLEPVGLGRAGTGGAAADAGVAVTAGVARASRLAATAIPRLNRVRA